MLTPPLVPHRVHSDTQIYTIVGSSGPGVPSMRDPNLNANQKQSIKTIADLKFRAGVKPIRRMDVSDAIEVKNDNAVKIPNFNQESQALAVASNRSLPPHLLLASLLEELCFIYVKDKNKAQHLFKILCERLSKLQVMAPLSHLDEMSSLRYQRRTMLNKLIRAAMKSMDQSPSLLALPDTNYSLKPSIMEEDIIEQQTSRYKNEFQELGILGKGGFGSVFKARNYLDGREYAVKKVRFKHKNTDLELKLLREVKALANLQHTNIVGYNAAWMEYDSPYLNGKERALIKGQKTQDSDSDTTDSVQFDNQDSMSIEFCLSDDKNKPGVNKSIAAPIPGGLAINAKLFSTVHTQDVAFATGRKAACYLSSKHTRLNKNHNRSSEEDSVVFVDSVHTHESLQKSPTLEHVHKGTGRSLMKTKNEHGASYFPKDGRNQENNETIYFHEEGFNITTETYKDASTNNFSGDSLWNPHNIDDSFLGNSSTVPQFHNFSLEDRHSDHNTTEFLTSSDVLNVHRQTFSTGCVVAQETSLSVDDQMNVLNTSQVHYHWCPDFTKFSDQKNPGQSSGVHLPSDFICLCQQATSSVVIDLKKDQYLQHHQENLPIAKFDSDSCNPADRNHCVLNTASPTQKLQLKSALPSLLISQGETSHNSERVISTPFQAFSISTTPKFSISCSKYNKAIKINPDKTPFTEKKVRNSSMLSHASSQNQQLDAVQETQRGLNIFVSHTSDIEVPFSKSSSTPTRAEKPGNRQAVLGRRGPLMKVSFRSDSENDAEDVLEFQSNYVFQNSITLYIQMELCTFTLQEWLTERNSEFHLKGCDDVAMRSENIRVFHQILQGVDFIHANGLIHRDLKPRNIFLSGSDLHVKIGDFGLATGDALKPGREDLVLTPLSTVTPLVFDSHTEGVGTSAYASPEQLNGSNYDFRSDMYSLGVMLYEMFHVFVTEMERAQEMQQLRRGNKCSLTFRKKWPLEADIVEALTNPIASMRPSAQDVLSSKLFLSHEQQVKMLQRKLLEQQKQMDRLQRELLEKDKIIAQLRRDQREKTLAEVFD